MGTKKKQVYFLVTDDMLEFLNIRAKIVGNRSEYLRHLVLQDMFGGTSQGYIIREREKQLENLSVQERTTHQILRDEMKDALQGGISGLLKPIEDDEEDDSSGQSGTEGDTREDSEV